MIMAFKVESGTEIVTTSATKVYSFRPQDLSSVMFSAQADLFIGMGGVSVVNGMPIKTDNSFSISHMDFSVEVLKENSLMDIYAVAAVGTHIDWLAIRR